MLELDQLHLGYGSTSVLRGVSFHLEAGQIGCLLGPSGCGKTSVLRAIAGFETPQAGSVRIAGRAVAAPGLVVSPEQRQVGLVFQDYALFPHLTVAGNIGFGLVALPAEARSHRINEMLRLVGLTREARRYPHQLSGGQQQRVALARALAPRPRLLLLDEPFSNLDVALREQLSVELRDILKHEATTALLVTHDQHEAFALADVVGILHAGTLQQWDTPYRLYHQPANRFVADFIGQGVLLPGEVRTPGTIDIELGALASPLATTPGQRFEVLIRPDDVLHDDSAQRSAEVVRRAFRGADFLYTLKLASGHQVLSLVPSHHDHAIGEHIGIRLELDHVVAFELSREQAPAATTQSA